jgi:dissimilatory sulfite reductase (desulfoviridin) alpha/beta subunit
VGYRKEMSRVNELLKFIDERVEMMIDCSKDIREEIKRFGLKEYWKEIDKVSDEEGKE